MSTWIFQARPDRFDVDGYFETHPSRFLWRVARYAEEMRIGDEVFMYRTGVNAGVIAEAEIIDTVKRRPEEADAKPFYANPAEAEEVGPRAQLRVVRIANNREILRRDWLREDPVLRELPNLKMPVGTNYPIAPEQADRLRALWNSSDVAEQNMAIQAQAKFLAASGLDVLLEKYRIERESRPARPKTQITSTRTYDRAALVVAIAKERAGNRCEVPNCNHPTFVAEDNVPYTEVHHIEPLSEGGKDTIENVACLCPAHHREVHVGRRASELAATLRTIRCKSNVTAASPNAPQQAAREGN
jgi:hypothetical protein